MTTKHTPAPWKILTDSTMSARWLIVVPDDYEDGDEPLAILNTTQLLNQRGVATDTYNREETEANAKLIAASPDMYSALVEQKKLNEWIETADTDSPFFEETLRQRINYVSDLIKEVINKIEQ